VIRIQFQPPRVPPGAVSNLVGLAGLVAVAVAVGGLLHDWWWSVLVGGAAAVTLAVLAQSTRPATRPAEQQDAGEAEPKLAAVPRSA